MMVDSTIRYEFYNVIPVVMVITMLLSRLDEMMVALFASEFEGSFNEPSPLFQRY